MVNQQCHIRHYPLLRPRPGEGLISTRQAITGNPVRICRGADSLDGDDGEVVRASLDAYAEVAEVARSL